MASRTLDVKSILSPEDMAREIAQKWHIWNALRIDWLNETKEVRQFLYSTDTRTTSNSSLPWRNSTHIPKLTQIRDNLIAHYMAALFPNRDWMDWEADDEESDDEKKRIAIKAYMMNVVSKGKLKKIVEGLLGDYVDMGQCFVKPEWKDSRSNENKRGWVGPIGSRISPLDIVFDPTAASFEATPKIVRKVVRIGELKKEIEALTNDQSRDIAQKAFDYCMEVRKSISSHEGGLNFEHLDDLYVVSGLSSWREHLGSDFVELLFFYGDFYDIANDKLYKNHEIVVIDKDKVLSMREDTTFFDHTPIYTAGWRTRQDSLWAMGPFNNLLGLQYRINHLENAKADMVDLSVVPPLKVRGFVEDFEWGPMERIHVGDDGDVEVFQINSQAIALDTQIERYIQLMELMAGAPREAMGIRSPGEKTKYEVQRLENAASRIFQAKIDQFEDDVLEPLLNAMLELARRNMQQETIRVLNTEFNMAEFMPLSPDDITGNGSLKPVGAKHFAEKAQLIQNLNSFFASAVGMDEDVRRHFSSEKIAKMMEDLLDVDQYNLVMKNVRMSEQAEARMTEMALQEQIGEVAMTPSNIKEGDYDQ